MTLNHADIPLVFSIIAFFTMLLLFSGILQYLRIFSQKQKLKHKIQGVSRRADALPPEIAAAASDKGIKVPFFNLLGFIGRRVTSETSSEYSASRAKFLNAGIRRLNAPTIFWGIKIFLAVGLALSFLLARITVLKIFDPYATLGICLLLSLGGFYLPEFWLQARIAGRKKKLFEGLPDALDLMVICVEAGMGLDAAIQRISQELRLTNPVLSEELKLLTLEIRAGKPRAEALRNLALRTDLEDVNSLVTLLIQTDQFGTSVAQTLRVYADSFRTRRFQRAEEIAARLPVKLIFPCVLFIFPSLFIVILGPALIQIFQVLTPQ
jgi:tight adherence protein C